MKCYVLCYDTPRFLIFMLYLRVRAQQAFFEFMIIRVHFCFLGELPYQVSIQIRDSGFPFCGGASVGKDWVATAAHCVKTQSVHE